jgi:hypothetical protein
MAFNPQDYEPVESRIRRFWQDHNNGRIHTEIVLINETEIVIKASIYADREDPRPVAIDFAQETRNSSPVNKISFVENCATSAIGRALATFSYSPKGKRPSQEEMEKVQRGTLHNERDWRAELDNLVRTKDLDKLRELRKDAVRSLQSKDFISSIDAVGKAITEDITIIIDDTP